MATAPQWLDLPTEILGTIFRRFLLFADHVRASAVCPQWRAVAVANAPLLPLLILPPTAAPATTAVRVRISDPCWKWGTSAAQNPPRLPSVTEPSTAGPVFVRIYGEDVHRLPTFPDDAAGGRICGSFPGGWVFLALELGHPRCCLLNVHTRERKYLPALVRTPSPVMDCVTAIQCATLSAAPSRDDAYLVAAITSGPANVAFWRPGAERWCPPVLLGQTEEELSQWRRLLPRDPVEDLVYLGGRLHQGFYALDTQEQLMVYVPDITGGNNGDMLAVRVIRYIIRMDHVATPDRVVLSRYLVEFRGNLLMIRHLGSPEGFDIFSLEVEQSLVPERVRATWRRCPDLTSLALFLGRGCSKAIEIGAPSHVLMHSLGGDQSWLYP